jgi:probable rRNA maturation factor
MAVVVDQRQRRISISRPRLVRTVDRALAALGRPAGIVEMAVVDDAEIRRLNGLHRGIARRTDVLAFPLEMPDGPLVGQLVICADAAVRQARRLRVPLALELDLLATHGTLHLAGYDDRDPVEADLMHRREREILGNTPSRLWRGLLHGPDIVRTGRITQRSRRRSPSGTELASSRPRSASGTELTTDRRRSPSATEPTADRPRRTSKSPKRSSAERSPYPSRSGHPRLKPRAQRSLQ